VREIGQQMMLGDLLRQNANVWVLKDIKSKKKREKIMETNEHNLLKFLKDHEDEKRCFKPGEILDIVGHTGQDLDTLEIVATDCRNLQARDMIIEKTGHASDPQQIHSCYRITQKGLDQLNPNTRDKNMYKIAKIAMSAAIIAAIASIIGIFT